MHLSVLYGDFDTRLGVLSMERYNRCLQVYEKRDETTVYHQSHFWVFCTGIILDVSA